MKVVRKYRQRERVKEVRQKAVGELEAEQQNGQHLNRRVIVVGQATSNPRAIRVAVWV